MTSGRSAHGSAWVCSAFDLAERARILPTFASKPPGSVGKVANLPRPHLVLPEGQEEVGPGVGIHDGLERQLGLLHLERGSPPPGTCRRAEEVADGGDVGVEDLRR